MKPIVIAVALALGAAGCATAPRPLQGEFSSLTPEQSGTAGPGQRVRWGGEIIAVESRADRTCFETLGKPLLANARPRSGDLSEGRFFACRAGFYDPVLFAAGRELTVIGVVDGFEERPIGDYMYRYPRVDAEAVYLWPEPVAEHRFHHYGAMWPHFRASPWGWHWYPHRVIVRPHPRPSPPPSE